MPNIRLLPQFDAARKKFVKRNALLHTKIKHTLERFAADAVHPSLHLEKLSGSDIWTIRVDRGNRLFFVWSEAGDTAIFFLVGPHDAYRKLYH